MAHRHRLYFPQELWIEDYLLKLTTTGFDTANYSISVAKNGQKLGSISVKARICYLGGRKDFPVIQGVTLIGKVQASLKALPLHLFLEEIQNSMIEDC